MRRSDVNVPFSLGISLYLHIHDGKILVHDIPINRKCLKFDDVTCYPMVSNKLKMHDLNRTREDIPIRPDNDKVDSGSSIQEKIGRDLIDDLRPYELNWYIVCISSVRSWKCIIICDHSMSILYFFTSETEVGWHWWQQSIFEWFILVRNRKSQIFQCSTRRPNDETNIAIRNFLCLIKQDRMISVLWKSAENFLMLSFLSSMELKFRM